MEREVKSSWDVAFTHASFRRTFSTSAEVPISDYADKLMHYTRPSLYLLVCSDVFIPKMERKDVFS